MKMNYTSIFSFNSMATGVFSGLKQSQKNCYQNSPIQEHKDFSLVKEYFLVLFI